MLQLQWCQEIWNSSCNGVKRYGTGKKNSYGKLEYGLSKKRKKERDYGKGILGRAPWAKEL